MDKTTCMELAAKLRSYWETVNVYDTMVKANDLACCLQGALTGEAEDGGWLHEFLRTIGPECGGEPDEVLPTTQRILAAQGENPLKAPAA